MKREQLGFSSSYGSPASEEVTPDTSRIKEFNLAFEELQAENTKLKATLK